VVFEKLITRIYNIILLLWAKSQLPGISNVLLYDYTLYNIKYGILHYIGTYMILLCTCYHVLFCGVTIIRHYNTRHFAGIIYLQLQSHVNDLYVARTNYVDIIFYIPIIIDFILIYSILYYIIIVILLVYYKTNAVI